MVYEQKTFIERQFMDPRIGQLCREGQTVFYAFIDGTTKPQLESTSARFIEEKLQIKDGVIRASTRRKVQVEFTSDLYPNTVWWIEYSGNPGTKFDWARIHKLNDRPSDQYDQLTMSHAFEALDKVFGVTH
jgi:hypothetical protein